MHSIAPPTTKPRIELKWKWIELNGTLQQHIYFPLKIINGFICTISFFFSFQECKNEIPYAVCVVWRQWQHWCWSHWKIVVSRGKTNTPSNVSSSSSTSTKESYGCQSVPLVTMCWCITMVLVWYYSGACVCCCVDSIELKCTYLSAWTVMYTKYYTHI